MLRFAEVGTAVARSLKLKTSLTGESPEWELERRNTFLNLEDIERVNLPGCGSGGGGLWGGASLAVCGGGFDLIIGEGEAAVLMI